MRSSVPDIQVTESPDGPGCYQVVSTPYVENVDYRQLGRAYTNVSSRSVHGHAKHDTVEVLGKTGKLPVGAIKAALARLVEATFHRNETDTNPRNVVSCCRRR